MRAKNATAKTGPAPSRSFTGYYRIARKVALAQMRAAALAARAHAADPYLGDEARAELVAIYLRIAREQRDMARDLAKWAKEARP